MSSFRLENFLAKNRNHEIPDPRPECLFPNTKQTRYFAEVTAMTRNSELNTHTHTATFIVYRLVALEIARL